MDSQIEEVKNKLNVLDVIGGYVKLTKTGINYRGVCPFHPEKKPSFFVSPSRQMWHCFGCGTGSSIFDFVMKIEGIEFGDALRILANKAGVELKKENQQLRTERQRLYEICELACSFFERQLEASVIGRESEQYLLKRGITKESIKKWRLGYSPDTWQGLSDFLVGKGYDRKEVVRAGLAVEKEDSKGESYDRFRGRIIFPIFDLNSQVVGFGGRVFKQNNQEEAAKYINTPQTLLYDKGSILYGLNNSKLSIRKQNQCMITEGYTDVIMCHQAGFDNTVSTSGTALTNQQLNILKRYSDNLILAFDMDVGGDSATKRGISLAQELGFNIKIIEGYLKDSDPADIILKDPELWRQAISKARSIMEYYFDSAFGGFDKETVQGKKEISRIILPVIKRLPNKIEQSYWIQKLSYILQIREEAIFEELAKIPAKEHFESIKIKDSSAYRDEKLEVKERRKLIEREIISLVLKNPDYVKLIDQSHLYLFSEKIKKFIEELKKFIDLPSENLEEKEEKDFKKIFDSVSPDDSEFRNFLAALAVKDELVNEKEGQEEVLLCLFQLKNIELKNRLNEISEEIKNAESKGEHQIVDGLIEEFNTLTKEL